MATNFTVGRTIECWKKHACAGCGCEYRYKFVRKLSAQGSSERAALDALNKKIDSAVGAEVDKRPCPTCGRVQPDMVGQEKAAAHAVTAVLAIVLVAIPIVLGVTYVLGGNLPAFIAAGILGLAAVLHLLIAIENLNKNSEKNVEKAATFIDDGSMQQVSPGDTTNVAPPPALLGGTHCVGLAVVFLAVLVALAPAGYQMLGGFAFNSDTKPDVISPGDEVKLYFPTKIDCVKSNWRSVSMMNAIKAMQLVKPGMQPPNDAALMPYAPPRVRIANANELALGDLKIEASSSDKTWPDSMYVKSKEKHTHPTIWATVRLPADDRLESKTIQLEVEMDLHYPTANGDQMDSKFDVGVKQTFPITLAKKGEASTYSSIWWAGLIGGTILGFVGGMILRGANKALKRSVPPPAVEIDEDEDEQPDDGEAPPAAE